MKKRKIKLRWVPLLLWMSMIFILSHQDATRSSQLSGGLMIAVMDALKELYRGISIEPETLHFVLRKGAHFTAYLVLGVLAAYAKKPEGRKEWIRILIICILYAAGDEYHQTFIPGRSGEYRDVLIDSAGSVTGILFYAVTFNLLKRRKRHRTLSEAA